MTDNTEKQIYQILDDFHLGGSPNASRLQHSDIQMLVDQIKGVIESNEDFTKVGDFMGTFNQVIREKPTIPPFDEVLLRLNLIKEETIEIAEACGSDILSALGRELYKSSEEIRYKVEQRREYLEPSLVGVLDGFTDLKYVVFGAENSFGLKYIRDAAFDEVHNSNMSKACKHEKEAVETINKYMAENIPVITQKKSDDCILILRSSDNKVLKSINYTPANLDKFIYNTI